MRPGHREAPRGGWERQHRCERCHPWDREELSLCPSRAEEGSDKDPYQMDPSGPSSQHSAAAKGELWSKTNALNA